MEKPWTLVAQKEAVPRLAASQKYSEPCMGREMVEAL